MDAIPLPLTPYSNGLLDAELKRARDFTESPKTNNAGLESYWYPAWTRWLDIVRARLTRKTRHMPSQPIFLSAPQLELYISREASPPDAVFMDVDVQTPRRLGRARTQKPDGNLQMTWLSATEGLQSRSILNVEVKAPDDLHDLAYYMLEFEEQCRLQALLAIDASPGPSDCVGAVLTYGRLWTYTSFSPRETSPMATSEREVSEWAQENATAMVHSFPLYQWSPVFDLDDMETPEHEAAFESLIGLLVRIAGIP